MENKRLLFKKKAIKSPFVMYPEMYEEDAYDKLFWKKEFLNTRYGPEFPFGKSKEVCKHRRTKDDFELQNPQEFVKNLISPETPYNGLLVLHGTGVGKTCSAIGITEGLRDYVHKNGKKIYVITPSENIRENFYKELKTTGCAGSRYADRKLIEEYYTFMGYGQFSNFIDRTLKADPSEMRRHFANSVIIIDEAHGIAKPPNKKDEEETEDDTLERDELMSIEESSSEEEDEDDSAVASRKRRTLFSVLTKTIIPSCLPEGGLKIVLLTATPMKDNITEMADLLEILNNNDGRPLPKDFRQKLLRFKDQKLGIEDIKGDLLTFSKGYVSFARGNNPISFPLERKPDAELLYSPRPRFAFEDQRRLTYRDETGAMQSENDFDIYLGGERYNYELFKCPMGRDQYKTYLNLYQRKKSEDQNTSQKLLWISNIAFPKTGVEGDLHESFNRCFAPVKKSDLGQRYELKADGRALKMDLANYSGKLVRFIEAVRQSPGISFAYSEFITYGTKIIAFILEMNGYVHYHPDLYDNLTNGLPREEFLQQCTFLKMPRDESSYICATCKETYANHAGKNHAFIFSTYVLITGETEKRHRIKYIATASSNPSQCTTCGLPSHEKTDHVFNSSMAGRTPLDQRYGQVINVIVGTRIIGQGVDFKWIRQVHILEPWHNNTRIYQVIGRGLRHCSHADLPEGERDVMVYRYCSTIPDDATRGTEDASAGGGGIETIDEHIYARVIKKDILVKQIERALKENAVDCEFNKHRNIFIEHKDFTRECDYMPCLYQCKGFKTPVKYLQIRIGRTGATWFIHSYKLDVTDVPNWDMLEIVQMKQGIVTKRLEGERFITQANKSYYLEEPIEDFNDIPDIRVLFKGQSLDNNAIWEGLLKKGAKIITHEAPAGASASASASSTGKSLYMFLDVPFNGEIDVSTYDLYFQKPLIEKIKKRIAFLYRTKIIYTLQTILFFIKKALPDIDDPMVYLALDDLLGKPLVDQYNREGYLINKGHFYIFQPRELLDINIPLYYREKLLDFHRETIPLEPLRFKEVQTVHYDSRSFLVEQKDNIMDVIRVFRYLDGALSVKNPDIPVPTVDMHISILESFTSRFYARELTELETYTYYAILEYFMRSSMVYFCDDETLLDVFDDGKNARLRVPDIPTLLDDAKYVVHVLLGKITYFNVETQTWSTEDAEFIKQKYFEEGSLSIINRRFIPLIRGATPKKYWFFIRPQIGEQFKKKAKPSKGAKALKGAPLADGGPVGPAEAVKPYIYTFISSGEKNAIKHMEAGQINITFNSYGDIIPSARTEDKNIHDHTFKLLTHTNKTGQACKSFRADTREGISNETVKEGLKFIIQEYDLGRNAHFLKWCQELKKKPKSEKRPDRIDLMTGQGFDQWYDSIEKSCEYFEVITRILDYNQFDTIIEDDEVIPSSRQWYLSKYMIHYYFKKK
jgi:hypothetical protein